VTARKPAETSFDSWIEQQIEQARREGRFVSEWRRRRAEPEAR